MNYPYIRFCASKDFYFVLSFLRRDILYRKIDIVLPIQLFVGCANEDDTLVILVIFGWVDRNSCNYDVGPCDLAMGGKLSVTFAYVGFSEKKRAAWNYARVQMTACQSTKGPLRRLRKIIDRAVKIFTEFFIMEFRGLTDISFMYTRL